MEILLFIICSVIVLGVVLIVWKRFKSRGMTQIGPLIVGYVCVIAGAVFLVILGTIYFLAWRFFNG